MTENSNKDEITPDFRSNEIHVKIDHQERTTSLTFQLVSEFHTMNRGYDEVLERSLQRFAITCRSKLAKTSQKAARASKKQSKDGQCEGAAVVIERPQPPTVLHNDTEVDPSTVMNYEIQTGMQIVLDSLTFHVVVNPPTVVSLSAYPKQLPYVGCPVVPQVAIEFADDFTCIWACETSPKSGEFVTVCANKLYVPSSRAEGCRVKLFCTARCTETGRTGRAVVFYLSGAVQPAVEPAREFNRMLGVREEFNAVRRAQEVDDFSTFDTLKQAREEVGQEVRAPQEMRVMTYNILAEPFATSEQAYTTLYPYCDQAVLQSEYRIQRILAEILAADADVVCLQECDLRTFEAYLLPILGRRGYQGHFTCKGSTEGCAVFTYGPTCRVVARVDMPLKNVLREAGYLDNLYAQRPDLRDVIGGKLGTVAQITVVECVQRPGQAAVVANSHLFYHPLASFLRTIQCFAITQALELAQRCIEESGLQQDFVKLLGGEETNIMAVEKEARIEKSLFVGGWRRTTEECSQGTSASDGAVKATVIFCGDLNSSPNIAAMQYLRNGFATDEQLNYVWEELKYFFWGDRETNFNFTSIHEARKQKLLAERADQQDESAQGSKLSAGLQPVMRHDLGLISAAGFPAFSNYTPSFQHCLDYVLVQERDFSVVRAAPCPGHEVLGEFTALPSAVIPSDHISIVVDLCFKD